MTRYEAYIRTGWRERGNADICFLRIRDDYSAEVGFFLVDLWCLGIKDAFHVDMPLGDFMEQLDRRYPPEEREALHPACARKLIEGAVDYAQALGFSPHRDFRKARRVFGSIKGDECPETFTFGKDGKPFFVSGPNDDDRRIALVLNVLKARLGPDGFHYLVGADGTEDLE
jgi:hypothetical protein